MGLVPHPPGRRRPLGSSPARDRPPGPLAVRRCGLVVLVPLLGACGALRPLPAVALPGGAGRAAPARVAEAIDGDTVDLEFAGGRRERVRLLGIDTPETVKPDAPVECYGPEASARAEALLPAGTEVLVQRDEEARDRYGRLLAYLWRRADGLFVNRSLVADGYARTLSIAPNDAHRAALSAAAADARAAGAGLWGACPTTAAENGSGP